MYIVEKLIFLMRHSLLDIINAVRQLSKYISKRGTKIYINMLYQCVKYVIINKNRGLLLKVNRYIKYSKKYFFS